MFCAKIYNKMKSVPLWLTFYDFFYINIQRKSSLHLRHALFFLLKDNCWEGKPPIALYAIK